MTVTRLHSILGGLIAQGHGRKPVAIDKSSFAHPLEDDGAVILDACGVNVEWVPLVDDDGGSKVNQDGTESGRVTCVLRGHQ